MTALSVSRDLSLSTDDNSLQMLTEHALVLSVMSLPMVWAYSLVCQRQLYLFGIEVGAGVTRACESLDVSIE